jgi:hypothetical protein
MTIPKYFEEFISSQNGIKIEMNRIYSDHRVLFTKLYNLNCELLYELSENRSHISNIRLQMNVILGLTFRILSNFTSALLLLENFYYNDVKAILRIIIENIELQLYFRDQPNIVNKWINNKYSMKKVVEELRKSHTFMERLGLLYNKYSVEGSHQYSSNLLSFFKYSEDDIRKHLLFDIIKIERPEIIDPLVEERTITVEEFEKMLEKVDFSKRDSKIELKFIDSDSEQYLILFNALIALLRLNLSIEINYLDQEKSSELFNQIEGVLQELASLERD